MTNNNDDFDDLFGDDVLADEPAGQDAPGPAASTAPPPGDFDDFEDLMGDLDGAGAPASAPAPTPTPAPTREPAPTPAPEPTPRASVRISDGADDDTPVQTMTVAPAPSGVIPPEVIALLETMSAKITELDARVSGSAVAAPELPELPPVPTPAEPPHDAASSAAEDAELEERLSVARAAAAEREVQAERRRILDQALRRYEANEHLNAIDIEVLRENGIEVRATTPDTSVGQVWDVPGAPEAVPASEALPVQEAMPAPEASPAPESMPDALSVESFDHLSPSFTSEVAPEQGAHGPLDAHTSRPTEPFEVPHATYPTGDGLDITSGYSDGYDPAPEPPVAALHDSDAVDALWAVGVEADESEADYSRAKNLQQMREEVKKEGRREKKSTRARVVLPRLPFQSLDGGPLVLAVYSPKGGAGKSTTSVNLGALIAASAEKSAARGTNPARVLVMDGDVANGNLAIRVANRLQPNMLELIDWTDRNGPLTDYNSPGHNMAGMADFVLFHDSLPNLNILAAPDNPEAFEDFTTEDFNNIIKMLGQFYDVIVIDCGTEIVMHSNQTWLRHAHQVFLLTLPERAALHSAGKSARLITRSTEQRQTLVSADRLHVVMMRSDADLGFDPKAAVKNTFPWADSDHVTYVRDYDRETARANNAGEFLSLKNKDYAEDLAQLATAAFSHYTESRRRQA